MELFNFILPFVLAFIAGVLAYLAVSYRKRYYVLKERSDNSITFQERKLEQLGIELAQARNKLRKAEDELSFLKNGGLMHQRFRTVFGVDILERSRRQAAAESIIGTELEVQTLELYRTHLKEFLSNLTPVPEFRVHGFARSLYSELSEDQRLYILNKFVYGTFLLTFDIVNEPMFIIAFRDTYRLEQNAERVRQLGGYKTALQVNKDKQS